MVEDRFLKRLRKKARKGLRGWPIATIAFYGPNLNQATKVTVSIVPSENAEVEELRDWKVDCGDIRADPGIAREILEFIEKHRVLAGRAPSWCYAPAIIATALARFHSGESSRDFSLSASVDIGCPLEQVARGKAERDEGGRRCAWGEKAPRHHQSTLSRGPETDGA